MELNTVNSISLANQLTSNFVAGWSKDEKIFVINDNRLDILKFKPNMSNIDNVLTFVKWEIPLSEYHVANETGIDIENILPDLERQNLFNTILNNNLTPKIAETNSAHARPIAAAWSPLPNDTNSKTDSLLGVVSNTGNAEIFSLEKNKWKAITNLTQYWVEHLQVSWKEQEITRNPTDKCETHKDRVNESMATCLSWSMLNEDSNSGFYYIIIGHASGYITGWKLNHNANNPEPCLVFSLKTNLQRLTSIHWTAIDQKSAWITFGDIEGLVQCLPITCISSTKLTSEDAINVWSYKDTRTSRITSINYKTNTCVIVIKGCHIILSLINFKNNEVESTKIVKFGNITVSGIEPITEDRFMVSVTTGIINMLQIIKSKNSIDYKLHPVTTDMKWNFHACHGVIKSPNDILWGILTHPCKVTDHLVLRNPVQITFCTDVNFDPGKYLKDNPTYRLSNAWECLEVIRCLSAKNNTLPCAWLATADKYDEFSLYELRIFMWISLVCETFIQRKPHCKKLKNTLPSKSVLQKIVLFKIRIERLENLLSLYEKNKTLSKFQYQTLYFLYDALKVFQKEEWFKQYLGEESTNNLNSITKRYKKVTGMDIPVCRWCGENLTSQPCSANHPEHRCCLSGVPIQGIAKWECVLCSITASEDLEDNEVLCPLCDTQMIPNY